ncbi:thiamine-phosphate kinase [Boudabousia marimammalium]|uniref:Thiamine-monophosphate kinase n=1 Tax=Boudabousia marimammalium TaxID=156892 RepID=A0A1Q5PNY0_9ACTO|nr:thiamine-phosphate kinase [Boudabousia marimammalium]OKL49227.1 thiamine-phosphate kinase [Boudabousia marimammalium]
MLVSELSEAELLNCFVPDLPAGQAQLIGPGDDCALIAAPDARFVTSTDMLVENLDFRRDWSTGFEVGQRLAAQNLADCAAMGAQPTSLLVCLGVPRDLEVQWVKDFTAGISLRCREAGVGLAGGDLSGAPVIVASATITGNLDGAEPVLRSGASAGDIIALAGTLGRSAAGLSLCEAGYIQTEDLYTLPESLRAIAADSLRIFKAAEPPLTAGVEARQAGASAMLDVSDGLLRDLERICQASETSARLDSVLLKHYIEPLTKLAAWLNADVRQWVLAGGEDHGMLATFPLGVPLPKRFHRIGECVEDGKTELYLDKMPAPAVLGWDHFRKETRE